MAKIEIGKYIFTVPKQQVSLALDVLIKHSLSYEKMDFSSNGDLCLLVHASYCENYKKIFLEEKIDFNAVKQKSIVNFITGYSKRWGILVGLFIMLLGVQISSSYVWKINIEGNVSVSDEEIIEILGNSGLTVGTFIPDINFDTVHNRFLKNTDDIAWISVNIDGNVANVKVRERMKENTVSKDTFTNVVAKCDGQIILISVFDGVKNVYVSDTVKKGDILISGIIDSGAEGVRYVHADGIVNAYVKKNITVKVPMKQDVKVYTGVIYRDKSVKVFTKKINIFKKYRNYNILCDKIESSENLKLFNGAELPIEVIDTKYLEYEMREIEYTQREAKDIANAQLKEKIDLQLANAILISQKTNYYCDFEFYYIECELYCIENIAELKEFEVIKE
ncbi:MAG: sporulation protein YqfD [Clostridia bacterium]|nr:sporulation protein YqfD [Clostridia bacterium]